MNHVLLAVLFTTLGASATWVVRSSMQGPTVVEKVGPAPPSKVRTRFVQKTCPPAAQTRDRVAELERETLRLRLDTAAFRRNASQIGAALPADLVRALSPERVQPELEALMPNVGEMHWVCDQFPCSGVMQFDPEHADEAAAFVDAVNLRFPGAAREPGKLDAEGWSTDEAAASLAVYVRVLPTELDEQQHRRAWFHRRLAGERMLREVRASPSASSSD